MHNFIIVFDWWHCLRLLVEFCCQRATDCKNINSVRSDTIFCEAKIFLEGNIQYSFVKFSNRPFFRIIKSKVWYNIRKLEYFSGSYDTLHLLLNRIKILSKITSL